MIDTERLYKKLKINGKEINRVQRGYTTYDVYYKLEDKYYQVTVMDDRAVVISILNNSIFEPGFSNF